MLQTSIEVRPYIWNIENTAIFFGLDLISSYYWVADWQKREVISGDFESLEDAEGTAYEYLFNYADQELLNV
jgi:hypothetical protein